MKKNNVKKEPKQVELTEKRIREIVREEIVKYERESLVVAHARSYILSDTQRTKKVKKVKGV